MARIDGHWCRANGDTFQSGYNTWITLDVNRTSIKENKKYLQVKIYMQNTITVTRMDAGNISGNSVTIAGVTHNFTWSPDNYLSYDASNPYIAQNTLVTVYNQEIAVDYGTEADDLNLAVSYYANFNPNTFYHHIAGSGNITLPKITNGHIKVNGSWKNAFIWLKVSGVWKRCIMWEKINGVWKKGI